MDSIDYRPCAIWLSGENGTTAWLQCMEPDTGLPIVSFIRMLRTKSVETRVHNMERYEPLGDELPRYAFLVLETDEGELTSSMEAMGFVVNDVEGRLMLTTGGNQYDNDLHTYAELLKPDSKHLRVCVDETVLVLPFDAKARTVFQQLLADRDS